MGYRSQVAGCISVDKEHNGSYDQAKFKALVGFIKLSTFWERWNTKADQDVFGWRDGYFILYGEDWKWYYDYPDVRAWNDLWDQLRNIEGISGYFLRVGEEHGDVEEMEFGEEPCKDHFFPTTSMYFSGDEYLGERVTDAKEEQAEQAPANP